MRNILLLMMGGSGTRFGSDTPKQYTLVEGIPIFAYILNKYSKMTEINNIIIVSNKDWLSFAHEWIKKIGINETNIDLVEGGSTRSESVLNGLKKASEFASDEDVVLMHDATHPYVDVNGTLAVIDAVKEYGGATLAQFQYDTVYRKNEDNILEEVVNRKDIVSGASPEAFKFGEIYNIYRNTSEEDFEKLTSAGAVALANNITMKVIETDTINLKITYKKDMEIFKKLVNTYFFGE